MNVDGVVTERDTARAMSRENVERVRQVVEANRSGPSDETVERAVALVDGDFEFVSRVIAVEGATYRGHDGVRAYFQDMAEAWQEWRSDIGEISEIGPGHCPCRDRLPSNRKERRGGRARNAVVVVLSRGRILRAHSCASRQAALEAVGLSE